MSDNQRKSMKLPADYQMWINTFKYPEKKVDIRTLDDTIQVMGVVSMRRSLGLLSDLLLLSDIALAPSDYFYYKAGCFKDRQDCIVFDSYYF
ncbi:hypothetical protein HanXRQr2_Chr05g0213691 [Helianthus annuus]|uniref:Uncharacterized protein n=1 Tax=Helianthus annuus TaxID=4232 RepID=A0A9K3IZV0_HELAN|nr:hypothetical protein HanXRQr2_Chr05g0213691 [Helianthus annuus]KAJ0922671.1 hypothetical protein HanPSC8_Chr05g0206591 [Helianthus annuus]